MLSFQNLKVGARLALGFGAVMVLLIIISALGVRGASQIAADTSVIYQDRMLPLLQLAKVNSLMLQNRVLLTEMIQAPARLDQLSAVMANNTEEVTKLLEAYTATAMKPDEASLAASFLDMRGRYGDEGIVPARAALKQGATEIAHQIYAEKVVVLARQTQEALDKLMAWQVSKGAKDYGAAQEGYSQVLRVSATGTLLAIAVAAWLAWTVSRSITVPTRQALALAERVAAGDLSVSLHAAGRNEMAQLLNALGRMTESLRNIVGQVRDSSESISTGSAEIAIGNADLSQRTEVQASNLQQTAATMEELSSTVRNNAQTATQANELAHSASVAAGRGGSVVGELVSNMAAISQSSHRISDIIGVIDGIAFQTNILALNAAVEAARAGEQGRGFAVVAGEVRSLAQRSAEAAREIKSLIGDSQTKVENGNRLADQAGGAMQDIVREVGRVSSMIAEIANASGEQSRGISQVGEAVGQLDQVTQQNAALVEQSAAAAESLRNQAGQLWELVASFRLR